MLTIQDVPRIAYEVVHTYRGESLIKAEVRGVLLCKMLDGKRVEGIDKQGYPFYADLDCFFARQADAEAAAAKDMEAKA